MYYVGNFWGQTFIYHTDSDEVMFGPFDSPFDAQFVCEMLNSGKLKLELASYGKEGIKDTYTVY
jgi:hypothetical protein